MRLVDIIDKYRISINKAIDYLNSLGADVERTSTGCVPNYYVPEQYVPLVESRFASEHEQYLLDDFCVRIERGNGWSFSSVLFSNSEDGIFTTKLPEIIINGSIDHDFQHQKVYGWSSQILRCGRYFTCIKLRLGYFWSAVPIVIIVGENNNVISSFADGGMSGYGITYALFSDDILEVTDKRCVSGLCGGNYTNKDYQIKTYIDSSGKILLRKRTPLEGDRRKKSETIKLLNGNFLMNNDGRWSIFDNKLSFLHYLDYLDNRLIEGSIDEETRTTSLRTYTLQESGHTTYTSYIYDDNWNLIYSEDDQLGYFHHLENTSFNISIFGNKCIIFKGKEYQYHLVCDRHKLERFAKGECSCVAYIRSGNQKKYGIVNCSQILLPIIFDSIEKNDKTLTSVICSNGKKGLVGNNGEIVIPPLYSDIMAVGNFYLVSTKGFFPTEFMSRYNGDSEYKTSINEGGNYYIIKANGDYSINTPFSDIHIEPNDFSRLIRFLGEPEDSSKYAIFQVIDNNSNYPHYGVIDVDGNIIIEPIYTNLRFLRNIESSSDNKRYVAFSRSGKNEWIKEKNTYYPFIEGEGLMDLDKNVILPDRYSSVEVFGHYIRTRKGTKYGLTTILGEKLIDNICTFISFMACGNETNVACFNVEGKWDIPDLNQIDYSVLDHVYCASIELKAAKTIYSFAYKSSCESIIGGKWGYFNLKKAIKSDVIFDEVHAFWRDRAIVKKEGNYYLINWNLAIIGGPYSMAKVGNYQSANYQSSDYSEYIDNKSSYEKYNGYNGYDDETIDTAFEGDPSLTWNID